jgi:hypothetical protein
MPGPDEGVIEARVIHDLNENGLFDAGEPGVPGWNIVGGCGDALSFSTETHRNGRAIHIERAGSACVSAWPQFGWLPTTPSTVRIDVRPGETTHVRFLVRRVGERVERFSGLVIQDGLPAAGGSTVDALAGETSCGESLVRGGASVETSYEMYVLSSADRSGCAENSETVTFTVNGSAAGSDVFRPFDSNFTTDLIVGPTPMFFYFSPPFQGAVVPYVGFVACGRAFLQQGALLPPYWQLVFVVSDETTAGCGAPGRTVTLRGQRGEAVHVLWEEGRVHVDDLKSVTPALETPVATTTPSVWLPDAGSGHGGNDIPGSAVLALIAGALLLGTAVVTLRRR